MSNKKESSKEKKISFLSAVISVLAAMIGIQKDKNRIRDFEEGNPKVFIAIGVVLTVLFVLSLILVVSWVLPE